MKTIETLRDIGKNLSNESLADKVYSLLEVGIVEMEIKPGEQLNEEELAASLNVSRSPVREALLRLEYVGLVDRIRKGRVVASVTDEKIINNYLVWGMTESYAAGLACLSSTEEDVTVMHQILEEMRQTRNSHNFGQYRSLNDKFHKMLVAPCPYKLLKEQHQLALINIRWGLNYTLHWKDDVGRSSVQHDDIMKAYVKRDRPSVERAVREHIEGAAQRLQLFRSRKQS